MGFHRSIWSYLEEVKRRFNVIKFPSEWSRGERVSSAMRRFLGVIDELVLRGLPLLGGLVIWSGGLNGQSKSRLDRFLVSNDWEGHFSELEQSTVSRLVSDHFPILLDGGGVRSGLVSFCFENMWLKEEGFKELLKSWWQSFNFSSSFNFILAEKLKALKSNLKTWNKEVFGKVRVNKNLALLKVSF